MVTAVICLSLLLGGTLYLLFREQSRSREFALQALELMKSRHLQEHAQYVASKSQTALNVEVLRDQFQKELDETPHTPKPPQVYHDVDGNSYTLDELEVI